MAEEPLGAAEAEPSPLPAGAGAELDVPLEDPDGSAGLTRDAPGTGGGEVLAGGTTAGAGGLGAAGRGSGTGRGGTVTVGAGGTGGTGGTGTGLAAAEPATTAAAMAAMTPPSVLTPSQLRRDGIGCASAVFGKNLRAVAVAKRDYYEVLGVERDADADAIRRAFHGLARDWHPDVAEAPDAEERFRELAEAYSVLSKRESRVLYDRYGYRGRGNQGFDEALWEARPPEVARGENIHTDLEVRSFEAEEGTRRVISFHATVRCPACVGRGSVTLPDPECEYCLGSGKKRSVTSGEAAHILQLEPCPACVGEPCSRCDGRGTVETERKIRLRIPPGIDDGTQLRVSGDGNDAGAGSVPGDLLVRVHVLPPPKDPRAVRYIAFLLLLVAVAALALYVVR